MGGVATPLGHNPRRKRFAVQCLSVELSLTAFTDKTGAVTGVLVKGKHSGLYQINAKAVVLATSGIGANAKLVQSLRPDISADVKTSNQPGSQGDGMVLAQKIGASVTDAKEIELNPTLLVGSPVIVSETVRGARAVFVNALYQRTHDARRHKCCGEQTDGRRCL